LAEPIWTTAEDIEAERAEVKRLRAEEDRKWERLRGVVTNVRRWETRVRLFIEELEAFRRRGWIYLTGAERERFLAIRDRLLPIARVRRLYWTDERESLITELRRERDIRIAEEERLKRKRIKIPPRLHRIKIRLYNFERKPTPTGMFQTFWDIDALVDPETGLVDWEWHLTKDEIMICKYHMVGYFKGMAKWRTPEQMSLAYFDEPMGVPYETERAKYKYSKNVPRDFIAKAEGLTVRELIVGISSVKPIPVMEPEGVFFERAMIIDADGAIKWDEIRNKFVWKPTDSQIEEIKKELKIK